MKKRLTALVLVLVMALSLCACGGSKTDDNQASGNSDYTGPSYTLTLGHVIADGTPTDEGADHFAQLVSEASGGKIKIEVYPNSALGDNRAMIESVQQGTLDMVLPAVANLAAFTTATKLFDLPFLFKNDAHAEAVLDGEIGSKILSDLESSGLVGLAWWLQGWRELTTDSIEFHKAGDLNGCKMRVQDNEVHIMTWQLLGASPTTLAYSELFTALQQGTINAEENPISNIKLSGFSEVQKYLIKTNHLGYIGMWIINSDFYNSLSDENRQILDDACAVGLARNNEYSASSIAEKETFLTQQGTTITTLTPDELEAFKAKTTDVWESVKSNVSSEVWSAFEATLN